jgi:transcriptional regulator with XRE-family HTH domain
MKLKVGDKLKEIRDNRKMSQEEFAELLGMSTSAYARLERNETIPDLHQISRICETLKVPIQDFLPDTATFQTHNDHGQIGCVFGTIYYYNCKDSTIINLEHELTFVKEKPAHSEEKVRLLESQVQLLQNLLERGNLHS